MHVTNVLKLVCMLVLIFDRNYLLKKTKATQSKSMGRYNTMNKTQS